MLSEAVLASYTPERGTKPGVPSITVTGVSPCAYATYLNYFKLDLEERSPVEFMRMEDGHYQEMKSLNQLRRAGFQISFTGANQMVVHVGEAGVTGRPDGIITVGGVNYLLEIKSMSLDRFTLFKRRGLDAFPNFRCQAQLYMSSRELKSKISGCYFYVVHKDSGRVYDLFEPARPNYIEPIVTVTDRIILEGLVPEKVWNDILCPSCRHKIYCWGEGVTDLSGVKVAELPEVVEMWKEGKLLRDSGEEMMENAKAVLVGHLGDGDVLYLEGLKLLRTKRETSKIPLEKFVRVFGTDRLPEVLEVKETSYVRITEVVE